MLIKLYLRKQTTRHFWLIGLSLLMPDMNLLILTENLHFIESKNLPIHLVNFQQSYKSNLVEKKYGLLNI